MYSWIRPLLYQLDPETAHLLAKYFLKISEFIYPHFSNFNKTENQVRYKNLIFPHPFGIAAGFDKNGEIFDSLSLIAPGFVELGSVSLRPWGGNPKPRLFRLEKDLALINRMGLPNLGASALVKKIQSARKVLFPVGISVVKTPDPTLEGEQGIKDFVAGIEKLFPHADFLTLNISCPNTQEGKTFEDPEFLKALLFELKKLLNERSEAKPVFLKLSPDLSLMQLDSLLEIAEGFGIDGYVLSNSSSLLREGLLSSQDKVSKIGKGGLSGRPLLKRSNLVLEYVNRRLPQKFLIASGGVMSFDDAKSKLDLGASLVQIYTGLIYQGPFFIRKLLRHLKA